MFSEYSTKCGKVLYLLKADAEQRIAEREAEQNDGWKGRSYQCPKCSHWHISTIGKRKLKKQKEERKRQEAKRIRNAEILEEKRKENLSKKKLEKIKQESAHLRKLAKKNIHQGATKVEQNQKQDPSHKWRNNKLKNNGSSIVESFGNETSGSTISSSLDEDTLRKLGFL